MTQVAAESNCSYRVGRCELQPSERRLVVAGEPVALATRAFDVLVTLVERTGQLVTKDELLERVWPNLVVEENNLQVQVAALRKLLGPAAIATVVRHGYRFTLNVERCAVARSSAAGIVRHNLPQQVTSFVGRARELVEVKQLLMKARLVTLVGVGGIGKTRLSLQVSAEVIDDYADGVWFIELAPLADGALVTEAVASVLGVKAQAGRPVLETLLDYVQDRELLLILNNCEHLGHACAELAKRLLQSAPRLKILTSSREHLNVAGETSYAVPSLAVPEAQRTNTPAVVTQYAAVRLFMDRAAAAQPAFAVTEQNAAAVADICARLDGIPLALELAAARVRALSVEKIAARLSDRFRLLTGGDTTALPRQQTLRACLDWSYELLTEAERLLLRRLAVFAGGWTLEAVEAVGAGGEIHEAEVLDLLTHLVEKSLVAVEAKGERYRLLETVRQYGQKRLKESGEEEQVRARHLNFFLALAEGAQPKLGGPEERIWLARLDLERDNLLAAHAWCDCEKGGAALGLRLVWAMSSYWLPRCLTKLGYTVTVKALVRTGAKERSLARCRALSAAGSLAFWERRYADAQDHLGESLSIAREL